MKNLLFQLDTDPIANTFDTVVAYDGGADHVTVHGGMVDRCRPEAQPERKVQNWI